MKRIPIIVLNWNGLDDTIACVESVLGQSYTEMVVYLADNGSHNHEFEQLEAKFASNSNVVLIKNEVNLGFGKAHNKIFEQLIEAKFEQVALINNDAVAQPNWLEEALRTSRETNADIVACKMIDYFHRQQLDSAGLFMLNTGEILPRGHGKDEHQYNMAKPLISFCAGACLINLKTIEQLGGFDPYFETGYEDAELGLRAFIAGKKISYSPGSVVYHKMSQSINKVNSYERTLKIQKDVNYTCLKLLPFSVLAINLVSYLPRTIVLLLVHLFTFRFRLVKVYFEAMRHNFTTDWKTILSERKKVKRTESVFKILKAQRFFLAEDLKRFNKYILKGNRNRFEKY